jgi:DNA sulfur modification protein DndB
MASKTFVPAFKGSVGDWDYYLCLMSYGQVAREVNFAYQLGGNQDLATMVQRGVGDRTKDITEYLLRNERRFLGAIVVAVVGGDPGYIPLAMSDNEEQGLLEGVDRGFGVLTFDGTHQFFALDGQHRLKAIKDALLRDQSLTREDIAVIVVPHIDDVAGRQQTRRLFTNINRNAVKTTRQEDIALDEDDGFAILTRRFLDEHPFLSTTGVVQVFSKVGTEGELKLATRQVAVRQSYWTTIGIVYDLVRQLGWDLDGSMHKLSQRATDEVLDESYDKLSKRLNEILDASGDLKNRYNSAVSGALLRAPKGREFEGHPFMRPVVQLAVARAVRHVVEQGLLPWNEALAKLKTLNWRMDAPPFIAVWLNTPDRKTKGKMLTGKDDQALLFNLLVAHLAPSTKAQINRVLADYKARRGTKYPVDANTLNLGIVSTSANAESASVPENPLTEKPKDEPVADLEDAPLEYVPESQEGEDDEAEDEAGEESND